jgi:putative transposase
MQLNRSIKTKLYPNARQKHLLHDYFNTTRFLWNKLLEEIKSFQFGTYKKDETKPRIPSEFDLNKRITILKKDHHFLQDCSDDVLKSVSTNLIKGFDGFYQKGGFPKFKSRKFAKKSINNYYGQRIKIRDNLVKINGSKEWIKFSNHRELPKDSQITGWTITKDSCGDYWLSLSYKYEIEEINHDTYNPIGCDLGLKEILTCSDGTIYPRLKLTKKFERKLSFQQRSLSRKKKGSQNYKKNKIKVAKIHRKIASIRKHNNHCISKDLVRKSNHIILENLSVKSMIKNRRLSKAIADVAWSQLVGFISYKQIESQGLLDQIDRWFASSKLCHGCGSRKIDLKLSDRIYICDNCGLEIDRDLNASLNIREEGIRNRKELGRNNPDLYKHKSVEIEISLDLLGNDLRSRKKPITL